MKSIEEGDTKGNIMVWVYGTSSWYYNHQICFCTGDMVTTKEEFYAGIIPVSNFWFEFPPMKEQLCLLFIICKTNVHLNWPDKVYCKETGPTQQRI